MEPNGMTMQIPLEDAAPYNGGLDISLELGLDSQVHNMVSIFFPVAQRLLVQVAGIGFSPQRTLAR